MTFRKFPSIEQFRNNIRAVRNRVSYKGKDENGDPIYTPCVFPTLRLVGTTKLHGCVHEDTLITLADGSQEKIKDVKPGTSILSFNVEEQKCEFDTVNEVMINDLDKDWVELEFSDGTILKCTADHPVLTHEGWVNAENLTEFHQLITEK